MSTNQQKTFLIAGDIVAVLIVTLVGFASHNLAVDSPRWLTTFLPLTAAWALQAPWLGLFTPAIARQPRQVWRAGLAALLAAPLAAVLRGWMLNQPVIIIFAAVLAATGALGMLIWRLAAALILARTDTNG